MKKNLRSCIEQPEYSEAVCFLDMNGYDWIEASGMKPDLGHKKSALCRLRGCAFRLR